MSLIQTPSAVSLLQSWYALELLTPIELPTIETLTMLGQQRVEFARGGYLLPWRNPEFSLQRAEKSVHWLVLFGECDLAQVNEDLLAVFDDQFAEERDYPEKDARGAVAVLTLDETGRLVPGRTFVACFPWSAGCVLTNKIETLSTFPEAETQIRAELEKRLIVQDKDGQTLPLTREALLESWTWLRASLSLTEMQAPSPGYAIRVPSNSDASAPPEPTFLNSFFLQDIGRVLAAARKGQIAKDSPVGRYLAGQGSAVRTDVIRESHIVREGLSPRLHPVCRWPGRRLQNTMQRPSLSLMQQFGLNRMATDLSTSGLFSVNGLPGTGKTTLLRDLVALAVCERAKAMTEFKNPCDAFAPVEGAAYGTGNSSWQLHEIDHRLRGHEILVASANNAAVENISRELPLADALTDDLTPPLNYFAAIAAELAKGPPIKKNPKQERKSRPVWGLAAAVLGNSTNRSFFGDVFWWSESTGLKEKLFQIIRAGSKKSAKSPDDELTWPRAVKAFRAAVTAVEHDLAILEKAKLLLPKQSDFQTKRDHCEQDLKKLDVALKEALEALANAERAKLRCQENLRLCEGDISDHKADRPSWWRWLFSWKVRTEWQTIQQERLDAKSKASAELRVALTNEQARDETQIKVKKEWASAETALSRATAELTSCSETLARARTLAGSAFADDGFWKKPEEEQQKATAWLGPATQEKRDEVFAAAIRLHEAFFAAAARPLRENLGLFFSEVFRSRPLRDEHSQYVDSVWSSLFLVVPVISTTFASVERMLRYTAPNTFGWLCIDEAGQAVPQQAVGALWRARRAVVVGDPRQIPPIVTTSPKLTTAICMNFQIDAQFWAAPSASAQILADRGNPVGTYLPGERGDEWVGSPLRVHHRCLNPMFKISNQIAYRDLMVYAAQESPSAIGAIAGASSWFDITGLGSDKWSPAEGEALRQLLRKLHASGLSAPDLYIISPFRRVAAGASEVVRSDAGLEAWLFHDGKKRIGTVHTFQGKDADTVILILGAQGDEFSGSRKWAARPSNLINVAVTRAKRRLYVIGSRADWKEYGAAKTLSEQLR